jgi:hypothetical protein
MNATRTICAGSQWGYFDGLKRHGRYAPLASLERFVLGCATADQVRWFRFRLAKLRQSCLETISQPRTVRECVATYNTLKARSYLDVATDRELSEVVQAALNEEVRTWIESEGAYSFLNSDRVLDAKKQAYEDLIQRTVKAQLRAALLRRGIRDVNIIREQQLDDAKRLDFVIWYGFIGPVVVELKLSHNDEVGSKREVEAYREKLLNSYMRGTGARQAVFVLLHVREAASLPRARQLLEEAYEPHHDQVAVVCLNCIRESA